MDGSVDMECFHDTSPNFRVSSTPRMLDPDLLMKKVTLLLLFLGNSTLKSHSPRSGMAEFPYPIRTFKAFLILVLEIYMKISSLMME